MWTQFVDSNFFTIFYPVSLVAFVLTGYRAAAYYYKKWNEPWRSVGIENGIVGFFALIISFTFNSSGNMMKDRNNLVHAQADAIAQLNREAKFLPEEEQKMIEQFLIVHINDELEFLQDHNMTPDSLMMIHANRDDAFLDRLSVLDSSNYHNEARFVLNSFGDLNSTFYRTMYSFTERTPSIILILLVIASWLIGILVGFLNGFQEHMRFLVPVIYIILATVTMQAIRDMDNPLYGSITTNYENLEQLKALIGKD